ncbi:MAG: hypothetical protein J07AB43_10240 [Candidatus Nanosalina sp. J07AB43]|jgi:hypothetical protein|nr:MAG: hypothetical protein J07AB43_10240 [Candidatus Nanosalina sp. J07AB43]
MSFEIQSDQEVDSIRVEAFLDQCEGYDDFGTTRYRVNEDAYDTLFVVKDGKVVGEADKLTHEDSVTLAGCYIDPGYRGELRKNGKSAFELLAEERTDNYKSAKTDATTDHGKTQHVYDKLDFSPYSLNPSQHPTNDSTITMISGHDELGEVYVPEAARDFTDRLAKENNFGIEYAEGFYSGADVVDVGSPSSSSAKYSIGKVEPGDQELIEALEAIDGVIRDESRFDETRLNMNNPSTQEVGQVLMQQGFNVSGLSPGVGDRDPYLHLADLNFEPEMELTPEVNRFLDSTGLNNKLLQEGKKSHSVTVKNNA